jgi:hypothetical protein
MHEFLLQYELEIHRKTRQENKDIEETLVIHHVDPGDMRRQSLYTGNRHPNAAYPKNRLGPGNRTIAMDLGPFFVEERYQNSPQTKKDGMDGDKRVQQDVTDQDGTS